MIVLTRIDNRLIHGQVVEAWLPHLKVVRIVVADDEAAHNPLMRAALGMAVPDDVEVQLAPVSQIDFRRLAADRVPTLVLVRDVEDAVKAVAAGLPLGSINVGNVHAALGRLQKTRSVFLSADELSTLKGFQQQGATVSLQAVPTERALALE